MKGDLSFFTGELLFVGLLLMGVLSLLLIYQGRYRYQFPIYITIFTPLMVKIGIAEDIYLHPAFILIGAYVIWLLILLIDFQFRQQFLQFMGEQKNLLVIPLIFIALFSFGIANAYVRFQVLDWVEIMRLTLYSAGFLILPLIAIGMILYHRQYKRYFSIDNFLLSFILIMGIFSVIGLIPVVEYLQSGGVLASWQYSPATMVVGTLGQYIDFQGIHVIESGASGNAGFLINFGLFLAIYYLLIIREKWTYQGGLLVLAIVIMTGASILTISRSSYITLGCGGIILLCYLIKSWRTRFIVLGLLGLVVITLFVLFPEFGPIKKIIRSVEIENGKLIFDASIRGRLRRWEESLKIITQSGTNFLSGVGAVNIRNEYGFSPHSLLFRILIGYGVSGMIVFVIFWWKWVHEIVNALRIKDLDPSSQVILLALLTITPGWFISNLLIGANLFSIEIIIVFIGFLGLALVNAKFKQELKHA